MVGFHIFSSPWGMSRDFSLKMQLNGDGSGTGNSGGVIALLAAAERGNQFASENHLRLPFATGICVIKM